MKIIRATMAFAGLMLWCAGATASPAGSPLPPDVTINPEAGCGDHLIIMIHLASGEELPFVVDTGMPITLFDTSLKRRLGKRLDTGNAYLWGVKKKVGVYATPQLYLGNVPLINFTNIVTGDLKELSSFEGRPVKGILGMDCLQHYSIQMDFAAGKMRFLKPGEAEASKPGKAYPLLFSTVGQSDTNFFRVFIHHGSLIGEEGTNLAIDTGLDIDGAMAPGFLREQTQRLKGKGAKKLDDIRWYFKDCVWDGETYSNLVVKEAASNVAGQGANILGLRFLARHLVTFDFPNQTMYLQRQSISALPKDSLDLWDALTMSLVITNGKLPRDIEARLNDMLKQESLPLRFRWFGGTLNIKKDDDSTTYHYTVVRKSKHLPWKLKKAWSTDQGGHTIEKYPIP